VAAEHVREGGGANGDGRTDAEAVDRFASDGQGQERTRCGEDPGRADGDEARTQKTDIAAPESIR